MNNPVFYNNYYIIFILRHIEGYLLRDQKIILSVRFTISYGQLSLTQIRSDASFSFVLHWQGAYWALLKLYWSASICSKVCCNYRWLYFPQKLHYHVNTLVFQYFFIVFLHVLSISFRWAISFRRYISVNQQTCLFGLSVCYIISFEWFDYRNFLDNCHQHHHHNFWTYN